MYQKTSSSLICIVSDLQSKASSYGLGKQSYCYMSISIVNHSDISKCYQVKLVGKR